VESDNLICAYCGELATTDDHVVAKSMLIDRSCPAIVPACSRCNNEKSRDDEYLRDSFAFRVETFEIPSLEPLRNAAIRSSERQSVWPPSKMILSTFRRRLGRTPQGLLIPESTVTIDSARFQRCVKWIVRGLYFRHTGDVLPSSADYQVWQYSGNDNNRVFNATWHSASHSGPWTVGGSLAYKVMTISEVPDFSNWLLAFYDRVYFIVSVNEKSFHSKAEELGLPVQ
jgi:hypothetical protein